ncbi:hypothetical protein VQ643_03190 [Pseudomonas sp. F1_0610]|uniref:hypothetical protein n=1 Tax=Pseudomonas sp. F1_0610 TaxID=3114284 RepID=UPI0039C49CB3
MQRVIRTSYPFSPVNQTAHEKMQLLADFCSPHLLSLYAVARNGHDNILEWWSPLGGQPIAVTSLPAEQQQALLQLYQQRQNSLSDIAKQLTHTQPVVADAINSLIGTPALHNLYSIDNQPVLINWDSEPPVLLEPPPVAPAVPLAVPAAIEVTTQRRLWPWLLALLLLLLLLGLLAWWLYLHYGNKTNAVVTPVVPTVIEEPKKPEAQPEPKLEPTPEPEPVIEAPKVITPKPVPEPVKVEPEVVKVEPPKPKPAPKAEPVKPKPAPTKPPRKFNNIDNFACTPNPKQPPPEFVVVFDTSGSMGERYPGSSKSYLDVSKEAFRSMISNLHPRIDTRLIYFTGWCGTKDAGVFTGGQRAELTQRVNNLKLGIGTPITPGLLDAASKINGQSRDALIVLFIDGAGNCGENVCAVAQRLARMKPRLQINVVDITGTGEAQCIAQATKGRVYTPKNINQMNAQLLDATKEIGKQCKQ